MLKIISNAVIFQAGWIFNVLYGNPAALVVSALVVISYLIFFRRKSRDLTFILCTLVIGWLGDSALGLTGLLVYPTNAFYPPFWLMALWLLFASSLTWSLEWVVKRRTAFILFCGIGGTFSYVLGVRLSDVEYGHEIVLVIVSLATLWIIYGVVIHQLYLWWQKGADL